MLTKYQVAASMLREIDICKHLFSKIAPEQYEYKPTEGQRTTANLLRYLAICGIGGVTSMAGGDWKLFAPYRERVKEMRPDEFPAAMDLQKKELQEFFAHVTDEQLAAPAPMPGGAMLPLGEAILNGPFKWLTAYKLQLFLYAKQSGASEIATSNAWRGSDPAP
jgi:hypothetical protein